MRTTPFRRHAAAAGGLLVLVVASLATTPAARASSSPVTSLGPNFAFDPRANFNAATIAASMLEPAQRVPSFAGLEIIRTGIEIQFTGNAPAALRARMQAFTAAVAANHMIVSYRRVKYSLDQLDRVTETLRLGQRTWARRGIQLVAWGPDYASNTVSIRLLRYTSAGAHILKEAYGSEVSVVQGDHAIQASSRTSDSAPWYGADAIVNSGTCTSWFSAHSGSTDYNLTAGHCGSGTWKAAGGATQGKTTTLNWKTGGSVDAQTIKVSSNFPYVWANPGATDRPVTSVTTGQPVGTLVCTDGEANNEVCSVRINQTGVDIGYDGITIVNQVYAGQTADKNAFTPGDSGGPVYSVSSGNAKAYGMIVAHDANENEGYYTPVSYVQSVMGVTVTTS